MSRTVSQTSLRALFGALFASLLLIAALGPADARSAQTCSNDKYRTGPSLNLPDCRAYEMVTPVKKFDQIASWPTGKHVALQAAEVAASGNAIAFQVGQGRLADDPTSGALGALERAFRTDDGWRVERTIAPPDNAYTASGVIPKWAMFSEDLKKVAFTASAQFSPLQLPKGGPPDYYGGAFLSDGTRNTWLSQPTWSGAEPAQNSSLAPNTRWRVDGGSPDLSTIYFASIGTHTIADATAGRPFDDSWALYKWENGELTNAAILPDGSLSPGGSTMADIDGVVSNVPTLPDPANKEVRANALSADAKSLLFVSPDPGGRQAMDPLSPRPQLYLRRDGEQTIMLSRRLDQPGDQPVTGTAGLNPVSALGSSPVQNPAFALATPDHSVVVFATKDVLTDSAAAADPELAKTYMYRAATGNLTYLPDMDNPLNPPGFGFSLLDEPGNLVALEPNGKSLLYVTPGEDLKLWREGMPTLQISSGVTRDASSQWVGSITAVRWLDGGDSLLLQSTAALRNEPLHQPPEGGIARQQIYLYRAQSDSLSCVSCKAGYESLEAAFSRSPNVGGIGGGGNTGPRGVERTVAADGSFVFTSDIPLVADDRNENFDVYRWKDGNLALISSGAADAADQSLYDISESGHDIFILSREKLVPWDIDNQYDIYTARVGGGFDPPAGAGAGCLGDGCQGDSAGRPSSETLGSTSLGGDGNLPATKTGRRAGRKVGFQVTRTRSAGDGRASLRVMVPRAGRIVVAGPAIRREVKKVLNGGNHWVTVVLKSKAARSLHRKDRLGVSVQVSYRPSQGRATTQAKKLVFQSGKGR